ncbi:MAG: type IV secretory system conjugative DNA transfer family protein, partial [Rubrivivax sp.]|nr:type IV secretory system conjugative DNA transfer family protein [Rubrivivax sp.]
MTAPAQATLAQPSARAPSATNAAAIAGRQTQPRPRQSPAARAARWRAIGITAAVLAYAALAVLGTAYTASALVRLAALQPGASWVTTGAVASPTTTAATATTASNTTPARPPLNLTPGTFSPSDIITAWKATTGDAAARKRVAILTVVPAVLFGLVLPFGVLAATQTRRPLHGAARFASRPELSKSGLLGDDGILLGRVGNDYLRLPGQQSVLLSAPTRSGKGVGIVVPNLLAWRGSVVVLDIKGENHELTAGYRARHGQRVFKWAPFASSTSSTSPSSPEPTNSQTEVGQGTAADSTAASEESKLLNGPTVDLVGSPAGNPAETSGPDALRSPRTHRWNPLSYIRRDPHHAIADTLAIAQMLYPSTGNASSNEAFFADQAKNLFL